MKKINIYLFVCFSWWIQLGANAQSQGSRLALSSKNLKVEWQLEKDGWHISTLTTGGHVLKNPRGYYTVIYLNRRPAANLVELDLEGKDFSFYPSKASRLPDGSILFEQDLRIAKVEAVWKIDPQYPSDIHVDLKVTTKEKGSFSVASPTIAVLKEDELSWGMVPGNWYGREVEKDLNLATKYSMGIPAIPFLARERNTMTLSPMLTTKDRTTIAVIPDPGTATDPWEKDSSTRDQNRIGLSTMNRHSELTPVIYAPVLGQYGSYVEKNTVLKLGFSYSIQPKDWFDVFRHAVVDIYRFPGILDIQEEKRSLSERVRLMQVYLRDKKKSNWNTWHSKGYEIGANGTKNADIGAMWMIAEAGNDSVLKSRLPYVRNYKLAQQETGKGFFEGSAMGEYADEDGVESERGNWVEPLFTTYYTLMDIGNILLYNPGDRELKDRARLAADRLIKWQHADGGFDVAYDRMSHQLSFPDLKDLRPTWYGLLIAYKVLGDERYLKAAEKGARWLIKNGVDKGYYLGVCGDARNIWDFATAQCSRAFLDLFETTKNDVYKNAAIEAAKIYATSIFTQPVATRTEKTVGGVKRQDWEISQVGLSVEHIKGTASGGPILLSSFTGLFVKMFELTSDSIFIYMARAAARGRDAFVDADNGQAIYYYNGMETVSKSAKIFPHHAFWQIGWITDYLVSEAGLRSGGKIRFPGGFMTPKVGPHVSYGFAPGTIYSGKASLVMPAGLLKSDNPYFEHFTAISPDRQYLYVMVLNQGVTEKTGNLQLNLAAIHATQLTSETLLAGKKPLAVDRKRQQIRLNIPAWGLSVIKIKINEHE